MLRFPDGGLLQAPKLVLPSSSLKPFLVRFTQPPPLPEQPVYPMSSADRFLSTLSRIQQATALLDQVTAKPGYKQVTLSGRENAAAACKRKRDAEEKLEGKKAKVVQQTLAAFVNKV